MGAESSILQKFDLGDPYHYNEHGQGKGNDSEDLKCTIFPAVRKKDGKSLTLLKLARHKDEEFSREETLIEVLKTIRHPNIVKFLGSLQSGKSHWLITEDSVPLASIIETLEDDELICGLFDIMKSLMFLHSKCQLTHNNIKLTSIFVSSKGKTWKLGGMDKVASIQKSPQLVKEDIKMFAVFAIFILDMLQEPDFAVRTLVKKLDSEFVQSEEDLSIMDVEMLLQEDVFRSPFIEVTSFLDDITLKSNEEKETFFKSLYPTLRNMNQEVLMKRLAPLFFSKFILAEPTAEEFFLEYLFKYSGESQTGSSNDCIFRGSNFKEYCVPIIRDLLKSRDSHVRLVLLKFLPLYINAFSKDMLSEEVLPEVLVGLKDISNEIVAATFKALSCLVAVLGGDIVVGGDRCKHFVDRKPKFHRYSKGGSSEDSSETCAKPTPSPKNAVIDNSRQERILERKRQRELARQARLKDKEKSPSKITIGAQKITVTNDNLWAENGDSEPEWEEYEASPQVSEPETEEPSQNTKERPTATVQPVMKCVIQDQSQGSPEPHPVTEIVESALKPVETSHQRQQGTSMKLKKSKPGSVTEESTEQTPSIDSGDAEDAPKTPPVTRKESPSRQLVEYSPLKQDLKPSITVPIRPSQDKSIKKDSSAPRKPKPVDKLGAEFEVEAKVTKSPDVDFFADMEPEVKLKPTTILPAAALNSKVSAKFKVEDHDVGEETASGWDEEGWDDFS